MFILSSVSSSQLRRCCTLLCQVDLQVGLAGCHARLERLQRRRRGDLRTRTRVAAFYLLSTPIVWRHQLICQGLASECAEQLTRMAGEQVAGAPRVVARDWELWLSFMNRWADGLHEAGLALTADIQVMRLNGWPGKCIPHINTQQLGQHK